MSRVRVRILAAMISAFAITLAGFLGVLFLQGMPTGADAAGGRVWIWAASSTVLGFWVMLAVVRVAHHRFVSPADQDGAVGPEATERVRMLQSMLQNTLEQAFLGVIAYSAALVLLAPRLAALPAFFAIYFSIGRTLFFAGYRHGAGARAFGFALTFYPSALLILAALVSLIVRAGAATRFS